MEDWSFGYLISGLGKSKQFYGFLWWFVSGVLRGCVLGCCYSCGVCERKGNFI